MTTIDVTATGIGERLDRLWSFRSALDYDAAQLSTDHPLSSRGQAVLLADGHAYGPADLPGIVLHWSITTSDEAADMLAAALAGGWAVDPAAYCERCGGSLDQPGTRRPGARHADCEA